MKNILFLVLLLICTDGFAQRQKTMPLTNNTSVEQVSGDRLSRRMKGFRAVEAFIAFVLEIWSAPNGRSLLFPFQYIAVDKVTFYESVTTLETPEGLFLKSAYFHRDKKCWQKKDETADYTFIKPEINTTYFNNFTFEEINSNEMNI
jgi:hypothetical protein